MEPYRYKKSYYKLYTLGYHDCSSSLPIVLQELLLGWYYWLPVPCGPAAGAPAP